MSHSRTAVGSRSNARSLARWNPIPKTRKGAAVRDTELQNIVLQEFYDHRSEDWHNPVANVSDGDRAKATIRVSEQLRQHGLIEWKGLQGALTGMGKITAFGIDAIEGKAKPPPGIHIAIRDSHNVQIGDRNVQ